MAASSKLRSIPNSLLHTLIRRNPLHPSAVASNLIPSNPYQSPYLFLLQNGGVKSLVNSSTTYSPILQFRSSLMPIEAARTYGTTDYVDYSGVEESDDIDDSYSDEEDIQNYAEHLYTDDDESEDLDD